MDSNAPDSTNRGDRTVGPYRRLMPYVRRYWPRLAIGFFFGALYGAANGALVWAIKNGLKESFEGEGDTPLGAVIVAVLFFPAVGALRGLAHFLSKYHVRWVGNRVVRDLRDGMFKQLHKLSVSYFSNSRSGELISRVSNDTMLVELAVSNVIIDMATQPFTLIFMTIWIFVVDAKLAMVSLVLFPLCIIPISAFGLRVRRHTKVAQERIADVVSILQESIAGVRIVKAFGMEEYETNRFMAKTRSYFERTMHVCKAEAGIEPIVVFVAMLSIAAVLVYVRMTHMPIADFLAFVTAMFMMYEPVKKIGRIHVRMQQSRASAERVFEVLDTEALVVDREDAVALGDDVQAITFDHVAFSYGNEPVLKDVSFCVAPGERVAFVGSSGAGKTTLVNLVPRFYDVTGGSIRFGEQDVRDLTLQSLRSRIGLVTQETFLFDDTVANNISYGARDADPSAIKDAAKRAYAHDFILDMPLGYDTVIGERGVRLSGGQRQRLAIARAILRNPPILILDEATSSLDTESERMVQAALDDLMAGRTVLAIAHRLSTITTCDRIIVLDQGHIIERGSHEELLALDGTYKRLYDMQFG
ncbi:MAG: ABC transporter ATP-binding protein [Lentisphaerae bacterium]|nr:ABC transporter ATP-binding protein [Lentisphaerota bacterium]